MVLFTFTLMIMLRAMGYATLYLFSDIAGDGNVVCSFYIHRLRYRQIGILTSRHIRVTAGWNIGGSIPNL